MKSRHLRMGLGFLPLFECNGVQAAQMVIKPGGSEGGPDNRHQGADQWLFVAAGTGVAIVEGVRRVLRPGSLLLIERGERHEIRASGRQPLKTINFYSPPAYTADGDERRAGKAS
ncbi:Cupin domain-containing protein [Pseudoxanthomonas sp. CF385]|uniref:cupin domain-containing protein n=1 Tax=Pseudoxanthomonas sp. CF385 TaxID=1881042 RepID=UPI00088C631E|nr:cupin domain-containing protein [Pseudoxanthomonas sp. CF385]SDQ66716.1 Cupin domain-containing protein [Pseudoxanthomonas sp. CF385]